MKKANVKKATLAIIALAVNLFFAASAYALFTIPEEERVNENDKNIDIGAIYNQYAPPTLKLKTHEDTVNFLNDQNASCKPKPTPNIKVNRNQHIPPKKLLASAKIKKEQSYAGIIFISIWVLFITIFAVYVFIVKIRDSSE